MNVDVHFFSLNMRWDFFSLSPLVGGYNAAVKACGGKWDMTLQLLQIQEVVAGIWSLVVSLTQYSVLKRLPLKGDHLSKKALLAV